AETGVLRADAGLSLDALIALALPRGWFPPVLPGTRWVSLGGAVANDVHGKNHHFLGSFGSHVPLLTLAPSDGRVFPCSPRENSELYRASIGGLGLTGLILDVGLQLRRVPGLMLVTEDIKI